MSGYKNIKPEELKKVMRDKDFVLLSARSGGETGIPETDMAIPSDEIENRSAELPQNKSEKLVIYCGRGNSSKKASEKLAKMGYKNVMNLEGGYQAWNQNG